MKNREFSTGALALAVGLLILVAILSYYLGQKSVPAMNAPQGNEEQTQNTSGGNTPVVAGTPATSGENIPAYQDDGKFIGYIKSIATQNGGGTALTIDYVQWIPCSPTVGSGDCMNGYKVVNANPQMRFFPVAANATVTLQTYSHNTSDGNFDYNQSVPLATFKTIFATPTPQYMASKLLYWITLSNGVVTNISEQYQP